MNQTPVDFYKKRASSKDVLSKISKPIPIECDSGIIATSSDYHIGNRKFNEKRYKDFCGLAKKYGAVHLIEGDVIDGICRYSVIHDEVKEPDPVEQIYMASRIIPEDGTLKYVLAGNHEEIFVSHDGEEINLCELLCEERDDIIYCGDFYSRLSLNGRLIDICHWDKKPSKLKKKIERALSSVEVLPEFMAMGHPHREFRCRMHGVECVINAGFKFAENCSELGGWFVDFNEEKIEPFPMTYRKKPTRYEIMKAYNKPSRHSFYGSR